MQMTGAQIEARGQVIPAGCGFKLFLDLSQDLAGQAAQMIAQFLIAHGGMQNGYETWAKGILRQDLNGQLELGLGPTMRKKTYEQVDKLGGELYVQLYKVFEDVLRAGAEVEITTDTEEGCFTTSVRVLPPAVSCNLWRA